MPKISKARMNAPMTPRVPKIFAMIIVTRGRGTIEALCRAPISIKFSPRITNQHGMPSVVSPSPRRCTWEVEEKESPKIQSNPTPKGSTARHGWPGGTKCGEQKIISHRCAQTKRGGRGRPKSKTPLAIWRMERSEKSSVFVGVRGDELHKNEFRVTDVSVQRRPTFVLCLSILLESNDNADPTHPRPACSSAKPEGISTGRWSRSRQVGLLE